MENENIEAIIANFRKDQKRNNTNFSDQLLNGLIPKFSEIFGLNLSKSELNELLIYLGIEEDTDDFNLDYIIDLFKIRYTPSFMQQKFEENFYAFMMEVDDETEIFVKELIKVGSDIGVTISPSEAFIILERNCGSNISDKLYIQEERWSLMHSMILNIIKMNLE